MAANLPTAYPNKLDYLNYYKALPEPTGSHPGSATEQFNHDKAMLLAALSAITKIFVAVDGLASVTTNWYPVGLPAANERWAVGEGCRCVWDFVSAPRMKSARIDGTLDFLYNVNTKVINDCIIVSATGALRTGTKTNPIQADKLCELVIGDFGPIDVSYDPALLSRSVIVHGHWESYGAPKANYLHCDSTILPIGATSVQMSSSPAAAGWRPGDETVITGNRPGGFYPVGSPTYKFYNRFHEFRTIILIVGNLITWSAPLAYGHTSPATTSYGYNAVGASDPDIDMRPWVTNMTRNLKCRMENDNIPLNERGHTMAMHSHMVNVQYMEFNNLGRTSKERFILGICNHGSITGSVPLNGTKLVGGIGAVAGGTKFRLTVGFSGGGVVTINGTEDGVPKSVPYTDADQSGDYGFKDGFWSTVTSISRTGTGYLNVGQEMTSRALTELGTRDRHGQAFMPGSTYSVPTRNDNVQGRYPFHVHKAGVEVDGRLDGGAIAIGISVFHSPGWGVAHHQSHMKILKSSLSDIFGAALVAESGNETGHWHDNSIVGMREGTDDKSQKSGTDYGANDPARTATSMWFASRLVKATHNKISDCGAAAVYNVRLGDVSLEAWQLEQPSCTMGNPTASIDHAPLLHFYLNHMQCLTDQAFHVVKANSAQGHDVNSYFPRNYVVSCGGSGYEPTYTRGYLAYNWIFISGHHAPSSPTGDLEANLLVPNTQAILIGSTSFRQIVRECWIEGWETAGWLSHVTANGMAVEDPTWRPDLDRNLIGNRLVNSGAWRELHQYVNPATGQLVNDATLDTDQTVASLSGIDTLTLDASEFTFPASGNRIVNITGTQVDGISSETFPYANGLYQFDPVQVGYVGILNHVRTKGYWNDNNGFKYALMPVWWMPREQHKFNLRLVPIRLPADIYGAPGAIQDGTSIIASSTAPTISNFSVSTLFETNKPIDVVARASAGSFFVACTHPLYGDLVEDTRGITYIPFPGFAGVETFEVWVGNANSETAKATVTITVETEGEAPAPAVNVSDYFTSADFNATTDMAVLTPEQIALGYRITAQTIAGGAATGAISRVGTPADTVLRVNPEDTFSGVANGTYTASDGLTSDTANWVIVFAPEDEPDPPDPIDEPVLDTLTVRTKRGVQRLFNALTGVTHPQGAQTYLSALISAAPGEVVIRDVLPNGSFTVIPAPGFTGSVLAQRSVTDQENTVSDNITIEVVQGVRIRV